MTSYLDRDSSPSVRQRSREIALVELVDEHGHAIAQTTVAEAHRPPGLLHRAFSVVLFTSSGRVLLQQRAVTKVRFAGQWGPSCCGHYVPGMSVEDCAAIRMREELGLVDVPFQVVGECQYRVPDETGGQVESEFNHVVAGICDATPQPDPDEVAAVRWMEIPSVFAELAAGNRAYAVWLNDVLPVAVSWHERSCGRLP
ncbi:MAG TPA: isopentenyl-diphosphate Delta-isomerase [Pseudonocardiaceae bacterium]|nr:isopentenyl-diphosphate Delta-isomerase [Pseudonocardiaceae bacterium]